MNSSLRSFADAVVTKDDLLPMLARAGGNARVVADLMRLAQTMGGKTFSNFVDIDHLDSGPGAETAAAAAGTVRTIRDWFIGLVDQQLQTLYRDALIGSPRSPIHAERLRALEPLREAAVALVHRFDWQWLADWLRLGRIGEDRNSCLRRLSNFAFECKRVNFRFTYHCNISCRHCYNNSGPDQRTERLALDEMLSVIGQMPAVGIRALNLTGGEPFLYADDLMRLISAGRQAGLSEISIYTNGFWASTSVKADEMLERLRAAGLMQTAADHLKISAGVYHQEFIDFDRVLILTEAYNRAFGRPLRVDFELPVGESTSEKEVRQRFRIAGLTERVLLHCRRVAPIGRGRELPGNSFGEIDRPCTVVDQIVFDPNGAARPCCGLNSENHGVEIGVLGRESLRDLIKRMQNDPVLQFLSRNSMTELFRYVSTPKRTQGYAGLCDICQHAIGGLRDKEALQSQLFDQQKFYPFWFS